jgi:hypothetical protein
MSGLIAVCAAFLAASPVAAQSVGYSRYTNTIRDQTINRPTVSPYLNLLQNGGRLPAYQTLVRPMLENERRSAEQSQSLGKLQQQVNAASRDPSGRVRDQGIRPTGHTTTYLNYSHYYSTLNNRR